MPAVLLQIQNATKTFGAKILFDSAQCAFNENEHVGVIGPNGAGKTTLFRCLTGHDQLDSGKITRSSILRLGYLKQEEHFAPEITPLQYWENNCQTPLWTLKKFAQTMGLSSQHCQIPINQLSGGYRMRCQLIGLIGQEPNLLLLDEPTNYLDLESLLGLEDFLQNFNGAFLVISHDREFLRRTTDHTLEIENGQFTKFNGHIDDYFEQKTLLLQQLEKQALSQEAKRKSILQFAARFGAKATKARQVQSRLKQLDKIDSIQLPPISVGAHIPISSPSPASKVLFSGEKLKIGYQSHTILSEVNLTLQRGDHWGIVGLNGAGKSTLLKLLAGRLSPQEGIAKWGSQVSIGYYAQHVAEELNPNDSVFTALMSKTSSDITPQEVKNLAGSLLFSGSDIEKKINILSGGEKARVALGQIFLQRASLLLLDEPTNHLDFLTVEALTQSLQSYTGAIVIVSHDRGFIKRVAKKIFEIKEGRTTIYPGTYDEYVWSQKKGILANLSSIDDQKIARLASHNTQSQKQFKQQKKKLEKSIIEMEKEVAKIQKEMAQNEIQTLAITQSFQQLTYLEAEQKRKELNEIVKRSEDLESHWYSLMEKIEEAKRRQ